MNNKYAILVAVCVIFGGGVWYFVSHSPRVGLWQIQGILGARSTTGTSVVNVLTGGYDNARTNSNLNEGLLTPAVVRTGSFGKLFALAVDGQIYAQPLYVQNVAILNQGNHNVVYAVTMHNSVYAFDADAPSTPLWTVNLGPSVPTSLYGNDTDGDYTDIQPENGIPGTPVIDPTSGTIYLVAATWEGGKFLYRLHSLDITTGAERPNSPVVITAQVPGTGDDSNTGTLAFNPGQHLQRPALLLLNGNVYAAFGSHGDSDPFHGWIMGYSATNVQNQVSVFTPTPNGGGGSFWQSGRGLTADDGGNIYAVSSNGTTDLQTNFGDNVLRLDPTATKIADWFSPYNVQDLNDSDDDLGTTGAILLPGTNLLVTAGKQGVIYLLDKTNLGHSASGDSGVVQRIDTGTSLIFNMACWNRPDGLLLYTHTVNAPVTAYRLQNGKLSTSPVATAANGFAVPFNGMTLSANGITPGTGVLWAYAPSGSPISPGVLHAYDAETLVETWNSTQNDADAVGGYIKFVNPTVANGKVYLPTSSNQLLVYGVTASNSNVASTPVITGIVNAASYANGALAPGEIIAILGQGLGPANMAVGSVDGNGTLGPQLGGVQVTFNGVPGPLYSASDGTVAAVVPYEVQGASKVTVLLSYNGNSAPPQVLPLATAAPGLFSADASGSGTGSILNSDGSLNSPDNPATAGTAIVISATGGGVTNPPSTTGAVTNANAPVASDVSVTVGGQPAAVFYCGNAVGQVAGSMQINLKLPAGVNGTVPVILTIGGQSSQATVTVSIQ